MKMKKLFCALILIVMACSVSFALSDDEYKVLMKDKNFEAADKALNSAWKYATSELYGSALDTLKGNQRQWIKTGRDREAQALMNRNKLNKAEAYARVTNARAEYILQYIKDNLDPYGSLAFSMKQKARQISQTSKPSAQSGKVKAWSGKNYIIVFQEDGKNSYLARFWTNDKNMTFDDIYSPGMRLSEAERVLDGYGSYYDVDNNIFTAGGNKQVIQFGINGRKVSYIEFIQYDISIPVKIQNLLDKYE